MNEASPSNLPPVRVVAMPGAEACASRLAAALTVPRCGLETRRFPDGEIYLRVADDVRSCALVVVAELRDPDPQLAGLLFLADALRDLGAASVGLAAPYLPYMRQDARFKPGEAITSRSFARLLSNSFDWLVTVDPHLHRHASLDAIYGIASSAVSSTPAIAAWVSSHVERPYLVGPDEESEQWVAEVAVLADCRYTTLRKTRRGDREVRLVLPDVSVWAGHTPVVVDDILSSGHTMAQAVRILRACALPVPVCIAVHAVMASGADEVSRSVGIARFVSCNSLAHPSNAIDVTPAVAQGVRARLQAQR